MRSRSLRPTTLAAAVAALLLLGLGTVLAQVPHHAFGTPHPFAVGAGEGAVGHQNAFGAWLLGWESRFYLSLTRAVRAAGASAAGAAGLVGLSFLYGVFHAAGPGHGKAVITSYMVSNEVALRRGLLISLLAALLQGAIATTLVGTAIFVFNATAPRMTAAARIVELASYGGIVMLGLALCWRKGRALARAVAGLAPLAVSGWTGPGLALAASGPTAAPAPVAASRALRLTPSHLARSQAAPDGRFRADDGMEARGHADDCGCGAHIPDPARFAATRFDRKAAALAVATAGARPCSGAILVLVFAASQGLFAAGVAATFAMALGTAVTTGALAIAAVFAKGTALRLAGRSSPRAVLVARGVEFAAAAGVLLFGAALLAAWIGGVPGLS